MNNNILTRVISVKGPKSFKSAYRKARLGLVHNELNVGLICLNMRETNSTFTIKQRLNHIKRIKSVLFTKVLK